VISYRDIAPQTFFYISQAAYNCTVTNYLMAWLNKADDTRQHDVTAGLHCWQNWTKFLLYPQNGYTNKRTNIARITRLI